MVVPFFSCIEFAINNMIVPKIAPAFNTCIIIEHHPILKKKTVACVYLPGVHRPRLYKALTTFERANAMCSVVRRHGNSSTVLYGPCWIATADLLFAEKQNWIAKNRITHEIVGHVMLRQETYSLIHVRLGAHLEDAGSQQRVPAATSSAETGTP